MKTFDQIREQMKPPGFFEPASKHREYNRQQVYKSWQKKGAAAAAAKGKKPTTIGQKVKDKVKSVFKVGEDKKKVDEISDKKLAQYKKKAFKQYNVSAKRKDDSGYTPAKRAQHADRFRKRSKGIGGYFQRDMAKKDRTMTLPSGKKVKMSTGSKYMHKSRQDKMYRKGKKGMTMTGRPASAMPKSYQNPDRD